VKGLSPVIVNVKGVDSVHLLEDSIIWVAMVKIQVTLSGSEAVA